MKCCVRPKRQSYFVQGKGWLPMDCKSKGIHNVNGQWYCGLHNPNRPDSRRKNK